MDKNNNATEFIDKDDDNDDCSMCPYLLLRNDESTCTSSNGCPVMEGDAD